MSFRKIPIEGSDGHVLAEIAHKLFLVGKPQRIRITRGEEDDEIPKEIQRGFIGLEIETIFTKQQMLGLRGKEEIPDGARIAYCQKAIEALIHAGKKDLAEKLRSLMTDPGDLMIFTPGSYEDI